MESTNLTVLEEVLSREDDPSILWSGSAARKALKDCYIDWILGIADWKIALTLTFREMVYRDVAYSHWRRLVRVLNRELFGERYTKIVKHSYFSYALGMERQTREAIHFHVIVDKPVDFRLIHNYWGDHCGFVWTDIIRDKSDCVAYIAKYNLKGGQVDVYKARKDFVPRQIPLWWKQADIVI